MRLMARLGRRKGEERTVGDELVLKADIEGGVGVGRKCHSCLACEVFGLAVFVADCIFDL